MKNLIAVVLTASLLANGVFVYQLSKARVENDTLRAASVERGAAIKAAAEAARLKDQITANNVRLQQLGGDYYSLSRQLWYLPTDRRAAEEKGLEDKMSQVTKDALTLAETNKLVFQAYREVASQAGAAWTEGPTLPAEASLPLFIK